MRSWAVKLPSVTQSLMTSTCCSVSNHWSRQKHIIFSASKYCFSFLDYPLRKMEAFYCPYIPAVLIDLVFATHFDSFCSGLEQTNESCLGRTIELGHLNSSNESRPWLMVIPGSFHPSLSLPVLPNQRIYWIKLTGFLQIASFLDHCGNSFQMQSFEISMIDQFVMHASSETIIFAKISCCCQELEY